MGGVLRTLDIDRLTSNWATELFDLVFIRQTDLCGKTVKHHLRPVAAPPRFLRCCKASVLHFQCPLVSVSCPFCASWATTKICPSFTASRQNATFDSLTLAASDPEVHQTHHFRRQPQVYASLKRCCRFLGFANGRNTALHEQELLRICPESLTTWDK